MIRISLIACVLATPLAAQCPDVAALRGDGISIGFDDGAVSRFRQLGADVFQESVTFPDTDDDGFGGTYRFGLLPIEEYDLMPDGTVAAETRWGTSFLDNPRAVLSLAPGDSVTLAYEERAQTDASSGRYVVENQGPVQVTIGDCTIDGIRYALQKLDADGILAAPEMIRLDPYGFAYVSGSRFPGEPATSFEAMWIR